MSAGYNHAGAVTSTGQVLLWGDNSCYQLGFRGKKWMNEGRRVEGVERVKSVSCSVGERYGHTGCVDEEG